MIPIAQIASGIVRKRKRRWLGSAFAVVAFAVSMPSRAQVIPMSAGYLMPPWNAQQVFDPTPLRQLTDPAAREEVAPEDQPVMTRPRSGYDPTGIRFGSWMFNPTVSASEFYDSNVFASNSNRQGDAAAVLGASLRAHTLWERHGIDITASTSSTIYSRFSTLNQTDAQLKGTGVYDIDHATALLASFEASFLHENVGTVSSPANAVAPTPYSLFGGDLTLRHEFGRFTGSVGAAVKSYDFGSVQANDGTTINQDARDGQIYIVHARLDYAFSDKTSVFVAADANERRLRGTPTQSLNSDGARARAGVDLTLAPLITGEIAAGYMTQDFADPTIGAIQGPAYRAMLTWSPSRLLDVHLRAEQIVTESSDTTVTGVRADAVQLGFDYELRRNVIWSSAATYERDHFQGLPRTDDLYMADAQIKYLMNDIISVALQYRFQRRNSNQSEFSYDKHRIGVTATARF